MNQTTQYENFFDHSKSIVQNFLTTAVVIDDRAMFGPRETKGMNMAHQHKKEQPPIVLQKTKTRKRGKTRASYDETIEKEPSRQENGDDVFEFSHDLNAKEIIQNFAEKKIICSVLKPEEQDLERLNETVQLVGQTADLIVLDWQLFHESGDKTLELIREIVTHSLSGTPKQLRLISVYTGSRRIDEIFDKIAKVLKSFAPFKLNSNTDKLIHTIGSCRIIVLVKEGIDVLEFHSDKIVPFSKLADRLIEEFTKMTSGLLSNVAMDSFSVIRQNTHKILTKFSPDLDAPYLNHRSCLDYPPDSKRHIEQIVSYELESLLEEHSVGEKAQLSKIKLWLKDQIIKNGEFCTLIEPKKSNPDCQEIQLDDIIDILSKGIDNIKSPKIGKKNAFNKLTCVYADPTLKNDYLDHKYAALTTLKSYYSDISPKLALGSILSSSNNGDVRYWLCLQPRCDSVRLQGKQRGFPLLPLLETGKGIKLILPIEKDEYKIFTVSLRPHMCKVIEFVPTNEDDEIEAIKIEKDTFIFLDNLNSKYKWIAELKFEFAQRIANKFATEISRVGTDNSEFLRRWEKKSG